MYGGYTFHYPLYALTQNLDTKISRWSVILTGIAYLPARDRASKLLIIVQRQKHIKSPKGMGSTS